ncbi:cyclic phosphodiesterase-like [Malus sylvestris]|uniref:cyclic phosphodiesterase-like n=1 Tax=Malus sylvestris TaxID=3752 RepID=UPI0021ABEE82|nr:cyclic phosphodiesterase-like [Malus sylvestris]
MPDKPRVHKYAIWAVPPDDVSERIKKVMDGLREEFGGPEIRPHIPIMVSIHSDHESIVKKFREICTGVSYDCKIERVNTSPCAFYYQCVYLFIDPEVIHMRNVAGRFGRFGPMPHLSLLYGHLTEEEKQKAKEKVLALDGGIVGLRFTMRRLVLYKCNDDMTQQTWEKVAEVFG